MIGSFLNFKNIDKKITPKRALTNKIKKILVSEDISLMTVSWQAITLIPRIIKMMAFGVFSLISILYIIKKY